MKKIGSYITKKIVSFVSMTFFSIMIGETKNVSTKKCLTILLRYYHPKPNKYSFLGLVELDNGSSAAGIYEVLRGYLV